LTFKREFPFEDALTMFEIISSQHLELSSMEAERERERQRAKELERDGNVLQEHCIRTEKIYYRTGSPFRSLPNAKSSTNKIIIETACFQYKS